MELQVLKYGVVCSNTYFRLLNSRGVWLTPEECKVAADTCQGMMDSCFKSRVAHALHFSISYSFMPVNFNQGKLRVLVCDVPREGIEIVQSPAKRPYAITHGAPYLHVRCLPGNSKHLGAFRITLQAAHDAGLHGLNPMGGNLRAHAT